MSVRVDKEGRAEGLPRKGCGEGEEVKEGQGRRKKGGSRQR